MPHSLEQTLLAALADLNPGTRLYVAYSGGLDSQTLLRLTAQAASSLALDLTALHVNHGLSANADAWQAFCQAQCAEMQVSLLCHKITLDKGSAGSLEQHAREARYGWFESLLREGDLLLMAHHREDQAETILLRMLRGSGARGLSAIPYTRRLGQGRLLRPFLQVPKGMIRAWAQQHALDWIEDESNYSTAFDRNYIRHEVMTPLAARWPECARQLSRSAAHCGEDRVLLDELAEIDFKALEVKGGQDPLARLPPLELAGFKALSQRRQRNLIQFLLSQLSVLPAPQERVREWLRQVETASGSAHPRLELDDVNMVVYAGSIHIIRAPLPDITDMENEWRTNAPLRLASCGCQLRLVVPPETRLEGFQAVAFEPGESVRVHWRRGGERIRLPGESFSRPLKKVLQQRRVAPWLRAAMPLISLEDEIVWSGILGDFSPRLVDSNGRIYSFEITWNR